MDTTVHSSAPGMPWSSRPRGVRAEAHCVLLSFSILAAACQQHLILPHAAASAQAVLEDHLVHMLGAS